MRPWTVAVFQHRGRMWYEGAHHVVWCEDQDGRRPISRVRDAVRWEGATLLHLTGDRTAERQAIKRRFYAWRTEQERAYREAWDV